jgi:methionyl-tRNA formyltransferase
MRYIFFGTPRFAKIVLDALLRANMPPPVALVCNPDRPVGRKKIITAPETKKRIQNPESGIRNEIEILQPEKIDNDFAEQLRNRRPDFFIVAAYAKIMPKIVLDIPELGSLGIHPSLLPKYRGTSPIQSAILGGEKETGVTIYHMDEKADHGPILAHCASRIANGETYLQLEEELAELGGKLLVETVPKFMNGEIKDVAQDENAATFTKKFGIQDGFVAPEDLEDAESGDPEKTETIFRKIRALNPEPGAWTMRDGKRLKLLEAKIAGNALRLTVTQREGEKAKKSAGI